jgi:hypothetical protein
MAAITSAGNGAWNSTTPNAPWPGGTIPVSGDSVTINHTVTIPSGYTAVCGTSPSDSTTFGLHINGGGANGILDISGTLAHKTNMKFTGDGFQTDRLIMRVGSVIEVDVPAGQHYIIQSTSGSANWLIEGTFANPCIVRAKAGGGSLEWNRGGTTGRVDWSYCTFTGIENTSHEFDAGTNSGCQTSVIGCIFDGCGDWLASSGADGVNRIFDSCTWKNSTGTQNLRVSAGGGAATKRVINCVFDKQPTFLSAKDFSVAISGNYFAAGYGMTSATKAVTMSGNLFRQTVIDGFSVFGDMDGNFVLTDADISNPHWFEMASANGFGGTITSQNNVFCSNGSSEIGDCHAFSSGGAVATAFSIKNNITLPSMLDGVAECGTMASLLGNANTTVTLEHNTCYQSAQGSVACGETYAGHAGEIASYKSNIIWSQGLSGLPAADSKPLKLQSSVPGPVNNLVAGANANYNGGYNLDAGSAGNGYDIPTTVACGANDVTGNPNFFAPTRNLKTWDTSLSGAGTVANALAEIAKRNDFTGYNSLYTISALLTYVRAGFAPTNAAYNGTAHDGTTIGAVAYQAPASTGNGGRLRSRLRLRIAA